MQSISRLSQLLGVLLLLGGSAHTFPVIPDITNLSPASRLDLEARHSDLAGCAGDENMQKLRLHSENGKVFNMFVSPNSKSNTLNGDSPQLRCSIDAGFRSTCGPCDFDIGGIEVLRDGDCTITITKSNGGVSMKTVSSSDGLYPMPGVPTKISCYAGGQKRAQSLEGEALAGEPTISTRSGREDYGTGCMPVSGHTHVRFHGSDSKEYGLFVKPHSGMHDISPANDAGLMCTVTSKGADQYQCIPCDFVLSKAEIVEGSECILRVQKQGSVLDTTLGKESTPFSKNARPIKISCAG